MNEKLKSLLPHVVAVLLFIGLSAVYFSPLFEDYSLRQNDVKQFQGMAKEIVDYRLENNKEPLWTNSMFGGMPAYQISVLHDSNLLTYVDKAIKLGLPYPVGLLFTAMIGFYIFALCLRINPWLAIAGAIGFGFSTINILYIAGGHNSKVNAIAYMAPTLGGLILAFRGKWLWGSALFALFLGLNITANHLQMTYYLMFLVGAVGIAEIIRLIIEKQTGYLVKAVGALAVAGILGVLPSMSNLLTTLEYSKYTTRGTTDLTIKPKNPLNPQEKTGLNKNYILEYNFGPGEFLSIVSPSAKGERADYLGNDEDVMLNVDGTYSPQIAQMNRYWGGQASSGGAFYFGVVMLVFFIMGLIFLKDSLRWPFLALFLLCILLASKDPGGINDFFINKVPMYNKFRDSKMILAILQVIIPAFGILFLDRFFKKENVWGDKKIWLYGSGAIVLIGIILYAVPTLSGAFMTTDEIKMFADAAKNPQQAQFVGGLQQALIDTRIEIYKADMGRSLFLVILGLGAFLIAVYTQLSKYVTIGLVIALVTYDNMSVSKRYLNNEEEGGVYKSYEEKIAAATPFPATASDVSILLRESKSVSDFANKTAKLKNEMPNSLSYNQITDDNTLEMLAQFGVLNLNTDYRVLSFENPFAETMTSFFHKSIGGYHGAKLKRFQEVVDFYVMDELQQINKEISDAKNDKLRAYAATIPVTNENAKQIFDTIQIDALPVSDSVTVLNMLNTKYVVPTRTQKAILNTNAYGQAWFVGKVKKVGNSDKEMLALKDLNAKETMVFNTKDFSSVQLKESYAKDSTASIKMTKYGTDVLTYVSNAKVELPAVFSEVYYPEGWNCYIDGKAVETFRADYILRATLVPAGKHTIEWKFEPPSFVSGSKVSMAGSILVLLFFFGLSFKEIASMRKEQKS